MNSDETTNVLGQAVVKKMKDKFSKGFKGLKILGLIFAALIIVLTMNPFVIIGAGERGVILNFGAVQPSVYNEGLHLRVPIMQKIIKIDVRVHPEAISMFRGRLRNLQKRK